MYKATATAVSLAALLMLPAPVRGQDWREVTSLRQRSGESSLDVHVHYGAGQLTIRPGTGAELYRVGIRYDAGMFQPRTEYRNGRLDVGVEGVEGGVRLRNHDAGEMTLVLSPEVALDMDLAFGAVEAKLDLGGLRVRRLQIETGASATELRFSTPNTEECERLELTMGAAAFQGSGLGNANCARVKVEGGVGDITLDFSGEWRRSIDAEVAMALGSVTLVIPENIGVRVHRETFLAGFDVSRFEKRDGVYYSDNWATAERRLTLDVEGAFGSISIRWSRATTAAP